jgi:hypothetical protein
MLIQLGSSKLEVPTIFNTCTAGFRLRTCTKEIVVLDDLLSRKDGLFGEIRASEMTIEQRIVVLDDFRAPPDYLTGDRP